MFIDRLFVRLLLLVLLNHDDHHGLSPNDTALPFSCLAASRLAELSWTAGLANGPDPNVCTNERPSGDVRSETERIRESRWWRCFRGPRRGRGWEYRI